MSRKRDRLKRKFNKTGNQNFLTRYICLRNKVNNLKNNAKERFYNNLELSISDFHSNDKKQLWKIVRHFVKSNNNSSSIPPLNSFSVTGQNNYCFSLEEKADLLNRYFTSISTVNDDNATLPAFEYKLSDICYQATSLSTNDFSTLYTTLPHNLIKEKLLDLFERTFYKKEGELYLACNDKKSFFTSKDHYKGYQLWSCQNVCDA